VATIATTALLYVAGYELFELKENKVNVFLFLVGYGLWRDRKAERMEDRSERMEDKAKRESQIMEEREERKSDKAEMLLVMKVDKREMMFNFRVTTIISVVSAISSAAYTAYSVNH